MIQSMASNIYLPQMCLSYPSPFTLSYMSHSIIHLFCAANIISSHYSLCTCLEMEDS